MTSGSYKEMGGTCPKNTKVAESSQQAPLKGKLGVGFIVTDFLMSDPLFLRSGQGQVTMFL